jgi:AcrR family transcriptional regulator
MKSKNVVQEIDHSTEEKIKNAARIVFHKKGYSATRTRDIAEEAGVNLALLNFLISLWQKPLRSSLSH